MGRRNRFAPGTKFAQARDLYVCDKRLRLLMLDALERVEVALRTDIAAVLGPVPPFAHRDPALLEGRFAREPGRGRGETDHAAWLRKLDETTDRSREDFVRHHRRRDPGAPLPVWMAVELWDFGMLSRFLAGMRHADQAAVARRYGVPRPDLLRGWARSLNLVRNIAAHHARLWNRPLVDQPGLPRTGEIAWLDHLAAGGRAGQTRLRAAAAVLRHPLAAVHPASSWPRRLGDHVATLPEAPGVSLRAMGFPPAWDALELWTRRLG